MNDNLRKWLPWILVAAVAVIIVIVIAVNSGGDDEAATTTTAADATTTTVAEETTTTAEETTTTAAEETTTSSSEAPDALEPIPVRIGAILPQTGGLASIISALEEPIRMGVEEFNAVSADLVTVDFADSGTDPSIASTNIDQFLTGDHNAIIGPAATGVANAVWDKVNTSEMVMCSGSSTGAIFSGSDFNPYHVRTAPSDEIQGPLLGNIIVDDGYANVAVIWRSDEYGEGFGSSVADSVEGAGATVVLREGYDFTQTSYTDLANKIVASGADAVAMIVFAEGGQIVLDLESAGFDGQVYVADGFVDNITADAVGGRTELIEGFKGTYPALAPATGEATFVDRLKAFAPDAPTIFSAHKYDCLVTLVLAAQVAQSSDPKVFVDEIIGVTRDGEKCSLIGDCLELVWAGVDIDYDGASGALDFSENGEPGIGTYDVFVYGSDMGRETLEQVEGNL
ncbi:MAG: ABC transporter substrate-binding protein [Actinomycetota bacterium]|nr:ABC transporter substrate-binding protein [Actinomycetota bacterium]